VTDMPVHDDGSLGPVASNQRDFGNGPTASRPIPLVIRVRKVQQK
jgi:hypothetical protein